MKRESIIESRERRSEATVCTREHIDRRTREMLTPAVDRPGDRRCDDTDRQADVLEKPETDRNGSVSIDGFDRSDALTTQDVAAVVDHLPSSHTEGLTRIEYSDRFVRDGEGVLLGQYDRATKQIDIYRDVQEGSVDSTQMRYTLSHEIGHHVYWQRLSAEQRAQWGELSARSGPSEYVTEYAKSNTRDDFAESYAFFAQQPDVLRDADAAKYQFMERVWNES